MATIFHLLPAGAAVANGDDVSETFEITELRWGRILDECLKEGVLPREPEAFLETLKGFRATVQADVNLK